jgi:hypothetical protein
MWNRSPVSLGDRVVGAKNVARVKWCDCSIKPISDGASRVTPIICTVSEVGAVPHGVPRDAAVEARLAEVRAAEVGLVHPRAG